MSKKVIDEQAFYHPETGELLNGIARSLLSNDGRLEFPDPTPLHGPVEFAPPARGMRKMVQDMIKAEFSQLAEAHEMETFADADDFDIDDDPLDPLTPWEMEFDPEVRAAVEAEKQRLAAGVSREPSNGSGLTGGEAPASPPPSPTSDSERPAGEPVVKRSVSNEPSASQRTAAHSSPAGAHHSE